MLKEKTERNFETHNTRIKKGIKCVEQDKVGKGKRLTILYQNTFQNYRYTGNIIFRTTIHQFKNYAFLVNFNVRIVFLSGILLQLLMKITKKIIIFTHLCL